MMPVKTTNPCREIIMSEYESCVIGTETDVPKNDPKCKGKKKLSNLSDDQFEWVKSQTSHFSGKDSDIYTPQYGVSFFGRDIWVSKKMCEWFILHYGTDDIQTSKDEEMRRLYAYLQKSIADSIANQLDTQIVDSFIKSYSEVLTKSK